MNNLQLKFNSLKSNGDVNGAQKLLSDVRARYSNPNERIGAAALAEQIKGFIRERKPGPDRLVLC